MKDLGQVFYRQKGQQLDLRRVRVRPDGFLEIGQQDVEPSDIPDFRSSNIVGDSSLPPRRFFHIQQFLQIMALAHHRLSRLCMRLKTEPPNAERNLADIRGSSLRNLQLPMFVPPSRRLLNVAHDAIWHLLPDGDCETFETISIAQSFYEYWKPAHPKVIVMAESHVYTEHSTCCNHKMCASIAKELNYTGPREFISIVYCLAYGERECLSLDNATDLTECPMYTAARTGTPQFWSLLAACLGQDGNDLKKRPCSPDRTGKRRRHPSSGNEANPDSEREAMIARLRRKLGVLQELKDKGIWLIDASIVGWYIQQEREYVISRKSFAVHRLQLQRPPKCLKRPTLVLSWELYTKHVIREASSSLKLLIPIGKEVEQAITPNRMKQAAGEHVQILESFPAPNAWCRGGYGPVLDELGRIVSGCLQDEKKLSGAIALLGFSGRTRDFYKGESTTRTTSEKTKSNNS
ncbi:expressed unknown protein [Seminavis robusta]|uniref:Uncharacterized protein n=1 Tax=Seminavis robusta TaxID=568900 RepID=A0A9N8DJS1_9STRA|nr:expressed unknown protein [Seminavis robusta]|eukprot:Sro119_g058240.1 n/a (463) ;mRNA; f:100175-101563